MKKRGLSDVVTTVLLILLVLAAVIIVWAFARVFILDNSAKIDTGVFNVGFSIPSKNVVITEDNNRLLYPKSSVLSANLWPGEYESSRPTYFEQRFSLSYNKKSGFEILGTE